MEIQGFYSSDLESYGVAFTSISVVVDANGGLTGH